MVFKDAVILSFFLDRDDAEELEALEAFKKNLHVQLMAAKQGRLEDHSYDAAAQFFKIELLGNNAEAMLATVQPLVREAHFLIGPRATLIMRAYDKGAKTFIRHIDL